MDDFLNLSLESFDRLLNKDEFVEQPVPLDVFIGDRAYMNIKDRPSPIQAEIIERASQIYRESTLMKLYGNDEGRRLWGKTCNELICELGKGSGKDFSLRIAYAYIVYKLFCLNDPFDYYQKATGGYIDLLNLAVNADQASNVFFDPLKNVLMRAPFFQDKNVEYLRNKMVFHDRNVRLFSGNSESEAWEGYDLLIVTLDEISAFKTASETKGELRGRHSAEQIYDMSKVSVVSRFPDVGKVALLSFPRFANDFIEERYYSVQKHISPCSETCNEEVHEVEFGGLQVHGTWAIKKPTWEVNPLRTKESFAAEYARNPVQAAQRFGVEPPLAEDAFFKNQEVVRNCFRKNENPLNDDGTFKPWFNGKDGRPRYVFIDLAQKNDRAALCMAHLEGYKTVETIDGFLRLPVVKMDVLKYWEATALDDIDFGAIRHFLFELNKSFNIIMVRQDYWNSVEFMKTLEENGVTSENYIVRKKDYDSLSLMFYDERLSGYWIELLVEEELLRLKLMNNNKVDHQCFVGETRIPTLDGNYPMMKDMEGQSVWVYSATVNGKMVPGMAKCVQTGVADVLLDVVLDNGFIARCTPEHLWMLRDGSYKEAANLIPGFDRLMPITTNWPVNGGYESVTDKDGIKETTHRIVASFMENRLIEDDEIVHHKNGVKTDNRPENLEIVLRSDHSYQHSKDRHEERRDWRDKLSAGTIAFNKLPETIEKRKKFMLGLSHEEQVRRMRKSPLFRSDIDINSLLSVIHAPNANQAAHLLGCGRNVVVRVLKDNDYSSWGEFKKMSNNNHKVRDIIPVILDTPVAVYDLQVEHWHNFALTGGVYVHNSGGYKDGSDALAGAVTMCVEAGGDIPDIDITIINSADDENFEYDDEPEPLEKQLKREPPREQQSEEDMPEELYDFLHLEML